ncbi:hypothetical protein IQ241_00290 [Romeria aff. gracilis LEGE 07310]|uniref:Uncharacterized protein n=1 Tax=Vasconcelosia minhoensis LEGE 07310 TaxID=915328 RepID=A0A8J7A421_9CYAN|nr:hypothetical protein [Romeria gracilis]MBE9075752.1 hypothetical protein [Romeria aff. gracilis LEGE 07310]
MIFDIRPPKRVGPVQLGMTPSEIRQILGSGFSTRSRRSAMFFMSNTQQENNLDYPERDVFGSLGLVAFYNESSVCHAIRLYEPAEPIFQGKNLLSFENSLESLRVWLNTMNGECKIKDEALVTYNFRLELGFMYKLSAEDYDSIMNFPPSEIVIFAKGYRYDW